MTTPLFSSRLYKNSTFPGQIVGIFPRCNSHYVSQEQVPQQQEEVREHSSALWKILPKRIMSSLTDCPLLRWRWTQIPPHWGLCFSDLKCDPWASFSTPWRFLQFPPTLLFPILPQGNSFQMSCSHQKPHVHPCTHTFVEPPRHEQIPCDARYLNSLEVVDMLNTWGRFWVGQWDFICPKYD